MLLAEATTRETYGRAFGLERAMDSAGAVIGPLLAVAMLAALDVRWVFACTFVPGILAVLTIVFLVREKPHEPRPKARLWGNLKSLPKPFKEYLVGVGLAGSGDFSKTLLIFWATVAWTPMYGAVEAGAMAMLFYVGYNVIYTVSCYVSGLLADRYPKHWVLSIGYSLAVVPAVALLWPGESLVKFAFAFGVSGVYMGVWETVEDSTAATILPAETRGTGFGLLTSVNGIGDLDLQRRSARCGPFRRPPPCRSSSSRRSPERPRLLGQGRGLRRTNQRSAGKMACGLPTTR